MMIVIGCLCLTLFLSASAGFLVGAGDPKSPPATVLMLVAIMFGALSVYSAGIEFGVGNVTHQLAETDANHFGWTHWLRNGPIYVEVGEVPMRDSKIVIIAEKSTETAYCIRTRQELPKGDFVLAGNRLVAMR